MTKLEKLKLANEFVRADIDSEIKSGERKPINLNPEIPGWIKWALYGTAFAIFFALDMYWSK